MRKELNMKNISGKFFQRTNIFSNDEGAAAIEYALIASATSLALVASLPVVENGLSTAYSAIAAYF